MSKTAESRKYLIVAVILLLSTLWYAWNYHRESQSLIGETEQVRGVVLSSTYALKGDIVDRSYTRIELDNGQVYRLPFGEMVMVAKGDVILLSAIKSPAGEEPDEIPVVSYEILERHSLEE